MQRLRRYIRPYYGFILLTVGIKLLGAVLELLLPYLMQGIIDTGINGSGGMPYILKVGAAMLVVAILAMATGVASSKFAATGSQGFGYNLRKSMFNHVQEFSFADIDFLQITLY